MKLTLNKVDQRKWFENQITFLKPALVFTGVLYLGYLLPRIEESGVSLEDFYPNNSIVTAWFLYVVNAGYDYLRKLRG